MTIISEIKCALVRFDNLQISLKENKEAIHNYKIKHLDPSKRDSTLDEYENRDSKLESLSRNNSEALLKDLKIFKSKFEKSLNVVLNDYKNYENVLMSRVFCFYE